VAPIVAAGAVQHQQGRAGAVFGEIEIDAGDADGSAGHDAGLARGLSLCMYSGPSRFSA